ncbi:MAG: type II CRISPR RNA-guided endonuclease Cas9, partial [Candidatus Binataceae bacterium]
MNTAAVLGLDLGTNSAGWALIEHQLESDGGLGPPVRLIDAGVRIFQEGVEAQKNESRNVVRRQARAMRRQHQRRNRRRDALRINLVKAGLLPVEPEQFATLMRENPYALRATGLDRPLAPFEFGRALYHLGQRRGFKSNRKTDRKAKKNETEGLLAEISQLQKEIDASGARTLGQFLASLGREEAKVRGRHTSRAMYEKEFELLWNAQAAHHPSLLSDALRKTLHNVIFHQRPLRVQKQLVGECELEPGRKRSPRATWYAQQFRILQDVSHLRVLDTSTGELRELSPDERQKLAGALQM